MKRTRFAPLLGALLLIFVSGGCGNVIHKLQARDQLNKGVGAFRNAQFQIAINYFQKAVSLDPDLLNARLYLATAYAQQYIPGGDSLENIKFGEHAISAFEEALKKDANNITAIASIAQIYYNMKKFDKAKEYQRRRLDVEPNNPEPYYWIGVINWAVCFRRNGEIRKEVDLNVPNAKGELPPLPDKARAELEKDNAPLVDEGLKALQKAIEFKPNDSDAMAYLNLLLRQKADIESDSDARKEDLRQAEDWVEKAVAIRKQATERAASR